MNGLVFAPLRAAGFTATVANGNSMLLGIGTDSASVNGIRHVNLSSADGYRAADQWYDFRDGGTTLATLTFGRATSAYTIDGHAWVFAVANGQVWNKMETAPGQWQIWQSWFPGTTMGTSPVDLEAQAAGRELLLARRRRSPPSAQHPMSTRPSPLAPDGYSPRGRSSPRPGPSKLSCEDERSILPGGCQAYREGSLRRTIHRRPPCPVSGTVA